VGGHGWEAERAAARMAAISIKAGSSTIADHASHSGPSDPGPTTPASY